MNYHEYQKKLSWDMKKYLKDAFAFYEYLDKMYSAILKCDIKVQYSLLLSGIYNAKLIDNNIFLESDCQKIYQALNIKNIQVINNYSYNIDNIFSIFWGFIKKYSINIHDNSKIQTENLKIEHILYNLTNEKTINELLQMALIDNNNYHIIKMKLMDSFTQLKPKDFEEYKAFAKTLNAPLQELVFLSLAYYQHIDNQKKYWHDKDEIALFLGAINLTSILEKQEKTKIFNHFGIKNSVSSVPYDYVQKKAIVFKDLLSYIKNNMEKYPSSFLEENGIYVAIYNLLERPFTSLREYLKEIFDEKYYHQLINRIKNYINNKEEAWSEENEEKIIFPKSRKMANYDAKEPKTIGKTLKEYGMFLNAIEYSFSPAVGREKELRNLKIDLLKSKSIILLGEAGVGKTTLVKALAYDLNRGKVPNLLKDLEIVKIDIQGLIAGTHYRGDFEEKVKKLIDDLRKCPHVIAYIEELHTVKGLGDGDGAFDLMNMLKPYLANGDIKIIGDTTTAEYDKFIAPDAAFSRRFIVENITEPNRESLKTIFYAKITEFQMKYKINFNFNVQIMNLITEALLDLTDSQKQAYYSMRKNPDILIDVLENIFAIATYNNHEQVEFDDLLAGINLSKDISDAHKSRIIYELKNLLMLKKEEGKSRVIKFPNKYALKP